MDLFYISIIRTRYVKPYFAVYLFWIVRNKNAINVLVAQLNNLPLFEYVVLIISCCRMLWEYLSSWQSTSNCILSLIARFMGSTWGPSGADRTQVGPMLAPWTLLFGLWWNEFKHLLMDHPSSTISRGTMGLRKHPRFYFLLQCKASVGFSESHLCTIHVK